MSKVLITGYKTYSFQNQQNELISGAKISYLSEMKSSKQNELGPKTIPNKRDTAASKSDTTAPLAK